MGRMIRLSAFGPLVALFPFLSTSMFTVREPVPKRAGDQCAGPRFLIARLALYILLRRRALSRRGLFIAANCGEKGLN